MKPTDVPHVARYLMDKHGLVEQGWTFALDNAKRRAGLCRYRDKVISLSKHYVVLNTSDRPDAVVDTILHEIAHALAPIGVHHGPEWRAIAESIGAKPERCYDSSVSMPQGRVVATCRGCSKVFRRHKTPKGYYHCPKCGPVTGNLIFRHEDAVTKNPVSYITPPVRKLR